MELYRVPEGSPAIEIVPPDFSQIEAGPECDRLVAQALGMQTSATTKDGEPCCAALWAPWGIDGVMIAIRDGLHEWHPSTDWNDAMLAAQRFAKTHNLLFSVALDSLGPACLWMDSATMLPMVHSRDELEAPGMMAVCRSLIQVAARLELFEALKHGQAVSIPREQLQIDERTRTAYRKS